MHAAIIYIYIICTGEWLGMQITFANSHWPFLGGDWASRVRPQTSVDISRLLVPPTAWGWELTPLGVLPPPMRWRTAPLWQTSAELRAGRHRTPSQDSTISALSQFLPVCWVSNGREELAGVTLDAPFLLTRGYERLFLPQFSSPDGKPWWNPPSTPGSQTGRSSKSVHISVSTCYLPSGRMWPP